MTSDEIVENTCSTEISANFWCRNAIRPRRKFKIVCSVMQRKTQVWKTEEGLLWEFVGLGWLWLRWTFVFAIHNLLQGFLDITVRNTVVPLTKWRSKSLNCEGFIAYQKRSHPHLLNHSSNLLFPFGKFTLLDNIFIFCVLCGNVVELLHQSRGRKNLRDPFPLHNFPTCRLFTLFHQPLLQQTWKSTTKQKIKNLPKDHSVQ